MGSKIDVISSEKLNDLSWVYTWFDNTIDEIISNMSTVKNEYVQSDPIKKKFIEYERILDFKIKETYNTLMKLHVLSLETPIGFYKKYHGPYRDEIGKGPFEEIKREFTYTLESFLTQLKSLIDLSIKFGFEISNVVLPRNVLPIDSFGLLVQSRKNTGRQQNTWQIIKATNFFPDYISNKSGLFEIQNYRDVIVHERHIPLQISTLMNKGEISFSYSIPKIKGNRKKRTVSEAELIDVIEFSRAKFFLVLTIILNLTNKFFTKEIKQQHLIELLKYNHNDIAKILCKMAVKGKLGEKWFKDKDDVNAYLLKNNIHPEELIEYTKTIRENKRHSSIDITEWIEYVPINGLEFYKVKSKYESNGKVITDSESYHLRILDLDQETYTKINDSDNILKHLQGCGLAYRISTDDKKFGPLEKDLKELIYHLLTLNQNKWTIQLAIHKYIEHLDEVEQVIGIIHGENYLERKKTETESILAEMERYEKWKKDPYYDQRPQEIIDNEKNVLNKIYPHDYLDEVKVNFVNWRKNVIIRHDTGVSEQLLSPKTGLTEIIEKLIGHCSKRWKKKPHNYTDRELKRLKKDKKIYQKNIQDAKQNFRIQIRKYSKLKPILKLINADLYSEKIDYTVKHPGLFSSTL
jgi:hypothetical protein